MAIATCLPADRNVKAKIDRIPKESIHSGQEVKIHGGEVKILCFFSVLQTLQTLTVELGKARP